MSICRSLAWRSELLVPAVIGAGAAVAVGIASATLPSVLLFALLGALAALALLVLARRYVAGGYTRRGDTRRGIDGAHDGRSGRARQPKRIRSRWHATSTTAGC